MVFKSTNKRSNLLRSIWGAAILVVTTNTSAIECRYSVSNDWGSGFTANITVTNNSTTAINGWQVQWQQNGGSTVTSSWNANVTGSNPYIARHVDWNGAIAPGASQSFGVQGNGEDSTGAIVNCVADGASHSSQSSTAISSTPISSALATSSNTTSSNTRSSLRSSSLPASSRAVSSSSSVNGSTSTSELIIQENAGGFCSVDGSIDSNNIGFTGSGFANADNTVTAGITYSINSDYAGSVLLDIRFATISNRAANIEINGAVVDEINFVSTGAWTSWTNENVTVRLQAGINTLRLVPRTDAGLPNVDSLRIVGNSLNPAACKTAPDTCSTTSGTNVLASCKGDPATCLLGGGVGNYRVSMKFNAAYKGELEIFAESRRKMFSSPNQSAATARCVDFLVNVRDPEGEPYKTDRGTAGLNLRITKGSSALTALTFTPVANPRTLFIAGDSTVADQAPQLNLAAGSRFTGWGQLIPAYFGDGIAISNYADSGESTAAFRTDGGGLWAPINTRLKSGDWVMIQLGHNDKTTSASLYRSRITNMVTAIRAKGANPILITPMIRNTGGLLSSQHIWGDLNIRNELIGVATAQKVPLIDLMKLSSEWAARMGRNPAQTYFVDDDRTHSNEMGAELFAQMIVNDVRQQNIGIANYLRKP